MSPEKNIKRRDFIKVSAAAALGVAAGSTIESPAILGSQNPNDVIGVGIIGVGGRGMGLIREALNTPQIEFRGVCDIWDVRLKRGFENCKNPNCVTYTDYRSLLENKDIDAVIIGTPDHWHTPMVLAASDAGKDIYSEKCMGKTIEDGKAIRASIKKNGRVYQLGHQLRSREINHRAKEIIDSGALGKVTNVHIGHNRNKPQGTPWAWFIHRPEDVPPELTPDRLEWEKFLGPAPKRSWDPGRYLAWRCFWDYGTGLAGDMQSHALDLANQLLNAGIPEKAYATGSILYWKDGREVPDYWHSVFEWPSRDLTVMYTCDFTNSHRGSFGLFLGSEATMDFYSDIKVYAEPGSDRYKEFFDKLRKEQALSIPGQQRSIPPVYKYEKEDNLAVADHMQDFFDCIRSRNKTRCNEDVAFEEIATTIMSVTAFQQKRRVTWDPVREEVV